MADFRKARILITAVYKNGDELKKEHPVPARVRVLPIPGVTDKLRELSVRMVVDSSIAEELLEGLAHGSVNLSIEQMLTPLERESTR